MWCLLLVLALVPTLGMAVFAAREATTGARAARQAAEVAHAAEGMVVLMDLAIALVNEQSPAQIERRAAGFGLTDEMVTAALGYDVGERVVTSRAETDEQLDRLPDHFEHEFPELAALRTEVAELRAGLDHPDGDPDVPFTRLLDLIARTEGLALQELAALTRGTTQVDARSAEALQAFAHAFEVFRAAQGELMAIGDYIFSGFDPERHQDLVVAADRYEQALGGLRRQDFESIEADLEAVLTADATVEYTRTAGELVADPGWLAADPTARLPELGVPGLERLDLFVDLTRDAGERAIRAVRAAEQDARAAQRRTIAASAMLGVLAIASAVAVAWSISRPLGRLARRATGISQGDLDDDEGVAGHGPREIRTVARALDEAAGNLRRVEEQARALAAGDLDHAVLGGPVPGALGESVQASVAQLSRSIREREALRERLAEQAHHDPLTGLLNRAGFLVTLDRALARSREQGTQVALLFVDLDGFKRANDSHGHTFGDEVLRTTASRIVASARGGDVVARLGGDEFVVIAERIGGLGDAIALGHRLVDVVSEPIELDGRSARVGASIGVALSEESHERAADLLADADQAVFRAKRSGRGRVEVCNDALREEVAVRNQIEDALRRAITSGELELHYQPVVTTTSLGLRGFEALVRWRRPGHGLMPPASFIPVSEASDLVVDLGRWVLGEATRQVASWSSTVPALADVHVSVNVSGRHLLNAQVVDDVRTALERSGLEPHRLVVEITETVILADVDLAILHLHALRDLGVRIALDDFGTGYTSIGQLGRLPVDVLKIDRSFVSDLAQVQDRSIVELMVEVAHTLGMGLVAEGVEDDQQLGILRSLACDDVQGYFIARPMPADDARAWAETGTTATIGAHHSA